MLYILFLILLKKKEIVIIFIIILELFLINIYFMVGNCVWLEGMGDLNYYSCKDKFICGCFIFFFIDEEIYKC